MEDGPEERGGQFGYKITTRLKVQLKAHETQIIFGIRIIILKNKKLGYQFPIFFILATHNTSFGEEAVACGQEDRKLAMWDHSTSTLITSWTPLVPFI